MGKIDQFISDLFFFNLKLTVFSLQSSQNSVILIIPVECHCDQNILPAVDVKAQITQIDCLKSDKDPTFLKVIEVVIFSLQLNS